MNYSKLFYWLVVADNAKVFFGIFAILFCVIFVITQIVRFFEGPEGDKEVREKCNKWTWYSTPFMIVFLGLWIFTPSKKDALLIVAGGQTLNFLTTDSTSRQIPHELSTFIVTELKNMSKEAKVDLGLSKTKEQILNEAKNLTTPELLERIKTDSTFRKLISE